MQTETKIDVPIARFAEAFFRLVIVLGVCVGGYLGISPMLNSAAEINDEQIVESFGWESEKFKEFLKECDRGQLISVMNQWIVDPNIPFESRQLVLNNQIAASQKIAKSRLAEHVFFGVSNELRIRSEMAMMGLEFGDYDPEQIGALIDLASLYKTVQFEKSEDTVVVNDKAKLSEIIGETVELVETIDLSDDVGLIDRLMEKVKGLSEHFLSSDETGKTLLQLSGLARSRLEELEKPTKLADRLETAISVIDAENKSFRINELKKMNCLEASASKLSYLPIDEPDFFDKFINKFKENLRQVLDVGEIDEENYSMILTKLSEISESGWPKESQQLLDDVVESFRANGYFPELEKQAGQLRNRLSWVGEKFSTDGMLNLLNRSPAFAESDAMATMVIFISIKTYKESDARLKQLGRVYNNVFRNARIDFLVVFMHEDDKKNGLQAMRVLEDRLKPVQFWQMNLNTPEGKNFAKSLNIDDTPYVKILDRSRRVAALNPRQKIVVDILSRLQPED